MTRTAKQQSVHFRFALCRMNSLDAALNPKGQTPNSSCSKSYNFKIYFFVGRYTSWFFQLRKFRRNLLLVLIIKMKAVGFF
jgi:hypothetical protein